MAGREVAVERDADLLGGLVKLGLHGLGLGDRHDGFVSLASGDIVADLQFLSEIGYGEIQGCGKTEVQRVLHWYGDL